MLEVPYCTVTFTKCPTDLTLGCNPLPSSIPGIDTNSVAASSCCGYPVTITGKEADASQGCIGYRLLIYTATDGYGNSATCTQTITWTNDTSAPQILTAPTNTDLGCNPAALPTDDSVKAQVTVADGCSPATVSVTHVDGGTPCAMTRTFTIAATDGCGLSAQPVTVVYTWKDDTTAPVITSVPAGGDLGCNPASPPTDASVAAQITAADDCTLQSTNVTYQDMTNECTVTRTFTITVVDGCGNVSAPTNVVYTWTADTTPPQIICPPDVTLSNMVVPCCTYTPHDYGSWCNGSNAASILTNCFNKVYRGGYVQCGITNYSGYHLKFTSCNYVQQFVDRGGTPGCLKGSYDNPWTCEAGSFAGQTLCLKLNVDFGDCKSVTGFSGGCGDWILHDSSCPLNGKSVRQILHICNKALGGGDVSSYGCTISNLWQVCSNLNQSCEGGVPSPWCQSHLLPPAITNVSPDVTGYAVVVDKCTSQPTLTYTDVVTSGDCPGTYVIARTWMAVDGCGNSNYCTQNIYIGNSKASACGNVFLDCNGDGMLTPGFDVGISNVPVTLVDTQNVVVATNVTDSQGAYCFYNLTPGTYTVIVTPPTNYVETAGTHKAHWLNSNYQQCWVDNDGNEHYKGADGVDCWTGKDGYHHWKNSQNQDCWKDRYGYTHTQSCDYVSCDVPTNNSETFTLAPCQDLNCVNFAYKGVVAKACVSVTGPSSGICGNTATYTCTVTNTGTACWTSCQVSACGNTYNCPPLGPGQGCSFQFDHQFSYYDSGNFKCQATATCNYRGSYYPCTAQGSCNTSVSGGGWGGWGW